MTAVGTPRTVLVTGASRGIGLTTARAFAADGHRVAVTSRSGDVDGLFTVACDVTDPAAVEAAVEAVEAELGPVEVLVSNAGITKDGLLARMGEDDFASVIDTNLTASWRLSKLVTRRMMRARWGRLIYVSSVVGLMGGPGQANYSAAKAGLVGLARSIARELGSRGITANVVAPGPIATDMLAELSEERQADIAAAVPLGRTGTADEVAAAIRFLASDEAAYITGAVLPVDGGLGMGH
jgi:NAD(P)-dependent dehydrogenase (short-subunit alcohol dehydrogenase family)